MNWIVEGFIPENSIGIIAGPPASYKSHLAMWLTGQAGKKVITLYMNGEDCEHCVSKKAKTYCRDEDAVLIGFDTVTYKDFPRLMDAFAGTATKLIILDGNHDLLIPDALFEIKKKIVEAGVGVLFTKTQNKSEKSVFGYGVNLLHAWADYTIFPKVNPENKKQLIVHKDFKGSSAQESVFRIHLNEGGYISYERKR